MGWLARRRVRRPAGEAGRVGLGLASQAQALRLELAERDELIGRLQADLRRQRDGEATEAAGRARAERERLFGAVATPLVQLATQTQLEGVDAQSMAAVARSLLRALADEGLDLVGWAGATESYDPGRHEPLGDTPPDAGRLVVVRAPGLAVGGVVLRRAGVEPLEEGG
jgi:hypothetical protein